MEDSNTMTENEIKAICKLLIENGNCDFTEVEKELLKQAVDQSRNLTELFAVALASNMMGDPNKK